MEQLTHNPCNRLCSVPSCIQKHSHTHLAAKHIALPNTANNTETANPLSHLTRKQASSSARDRIPSDGAGQGTPNADPPSPAGLLANGIFHPTAPLPQQRRLSNSQTTLYLPATRPLSPTHLRSSHRPVKLAPTRIRSPWPPLSKPSTRRFAPTSTRITSARLVGSAFSYHIILAKL